MLEKWSTVILKPKFWWRLKFLLNPHDLVFCWGDDKWMLGGFTGEECLSIGGVPANMRHRLPAEPPQAKEMKE